MFNHVTRDLRSNGVHFQPASAELIDVSSVDYAPSAEVASPGNPNPKVAFLVYVGGAGNLKVDPAIGGTGVVFINVADGGVFPILVKKVWSAGTTASNLIAVW